MPPQPSPTQSWGGAQRLPPHRLQAADARAYARAVSACDRHRRLIPGASVRHDLLPQEAPVASLTAKIPSGRLSRRSRRVPWCWSPRFRQRQPWRRPGNQPQWMRNYRNRSRPPRQRSRRRAQRLPAREGRREEGLLCKSQRILRGANVPRTTRRDGRIDETTESNS